MPGMLEDIIERTKEAADSYLSQSHARMNGVQIGPVGINWTYVQEAQGNWRTCMNGIFRQLEKHGIGLLSKRPIGSFPITSRQCRLATERPPSAGILDGIEFYGQ